MPDDEEELALTLNGKKKKIKRADFEHAMHDSGMDDKAIANVFTKFSKAMPKWSALIKQSYLPEDKQTELQAQIDRMASRINLI